MPLLALSALAPACAHAQIAWTRLSYTPLSNGGDLELESQVHTSNGAGTANLSGSFRIVRKVTGSTDNTPPWHSEYAKLFDNSYDKAYDIPVTFTKAGQRAWVFMWCSTLGGNEYFHGRDAGGNSYDVGRGATYYTPKQDPALSGPYG